MLQQHVDMHMALGRSLQHPVDQCILWTNALCILWTNALCILWTNASCGPMHPVDQCILWTNASCGPMHPVDQCIAHPVDQCIAHPVDQCILWTNALYIEGGNSNGQHTHLVTYGTTLQPRCSMTCGNTGQGSYLRTTLSKGCS
jgi:hypothetical protein